MIIATDIAFYLSTACYVIAALLSIQFIRTSDPRLISVARRLVVFGVLLLAATFALRWTTWGLLPLTTTMDIFNLFVLLSSIVMLLSSRLESAGALHCFYLPPLAFIGVLSAVAAPQALHTTPRNLLGLALGIHVGLAFLAYSLFFVASLTSVAYVFKTQQLKHRPSSRLFSQLPALEQLDRSLYHLISFGYPLFIVTLGIGLMWAWHDRDLLGPHWWLSPKVILSYFMVGFYALSFHTRRFGLLRGRTLAYFVFYGFTLLLTAFLLLRLLDLSDYSFWGSKP